MSEDIDLKIISNEPYSRAELRKLRDKITRALLDAEFQFDPENAEHWDSGNARVLAKRRRSGFQPAFAQLQE